MKQTKISNLTFRTPLIAAFWLLMLLFIRPNAYSQSSGLKQIDAGPAHVTSVDGLVLRERPGTEQKRLAVMPFGAMVTVLDSAGGKLDSLAPLRSGYQEDGKWKSATVSRAVHWVRVSYKGTQGYALDVFLLHAFDGNPLENRLDEYGNVPGINTSFLLLVPGNDCNVNLVNRRDIHWYGVYVKGGKLCIRPATLRQFCSHEDWDGYTRDWFHTYADDSQGLLWLLGTTSSSAFNSEFACTYCPMMLPEDSHWGETQQRIYTQAGLSIGCGDLPPSANCECRVSYRRGGKMQLLKDPAGNLCYSGVELIADLDGDGQQDLILSYGEESQRKVLYLSRQARAGELLRPVAIYTTGYCC